MNEKQITVTSPLLPDLEEFNAQVEMHKAKIKEIFDQNGILNPDIKLGASSKFTLTHFRNASLPKFML